MHYKTNNQSVGELLVQFFEFYTKEFDYKKYSVCISTTTKKYINTVSLKNSLYLKENIDFTNDVKIYV